MCDACRWSDHDRCNRYLTDGRRLRCLCRACLPPRQMLRVDEPVALTLVTGSGLGPAPSPGTERPRLRLVRGGP